MKDNFSRRADEYAKYRPSYPPELIEFILLQVPGRHRAWDCATGNGQAARELALHFETVYATDISQQQLDHAVTAPNIFYSLQPAEHTDFPRDHFDLVTVAQALHWFDFDAFYTEVKRTGKNGSLLAAWMYGLLAISPAIDPIIYRLYKEVLGDYWDYERKYVDDKYTTIPFPFEEISSPVFEIRFQWTLAELEGYLNTWSALQKFIQKNGYNPVPAFMQEILPLWGEKRELHFPLHLRLGKIKK